MRVIENLNPGQAGYPQLLRQLPHRFLRRFILPLHHFKFLKQVGFGVVGRHVQQLFAVALDRLDQLTGDDLLQRFDIQLQRYDHFLRQRMVLIILH